MSLNFGGYDLVVWQGDKHVGSVNLPAGPNCTPHAALQAWAATAEAERVVSTAGCDWQTSVELRFVFTVITKMP